MKVQLNLKNIWEKTWNRTRRSIFIFFGVISVVLLITGIWKVTHSPLFVIQIVEVIDLPANSPVDTLTLQKWLGIVPGTVGLFEMNLGELEARVLQNKSQNNWIRKIQFYKRFPQSLAVKVEFRKPVAFFQFPSGTLTYLDENGVTFGQATLSMSVDLPIFSGFDAHDSVKIREGLYISALWVKQGLDRDYPISTLMFDADRGYRVLTSYKMHVLQAQARPSLSNAGNTAVFSRRPIIDLGLDVRDAQFEAQLGRISQVLEYLSNKGVSARQILGDSGKKIIVRRGN